LLAKEGAKKAAIINFGNKIEDIDKIKEEIESKVKEFKEIVN